MLKPLVIIFISFPLFIYSQGFSPQIISTAGSQGSTANYKLSYTIGQLNTNSGSGSSIVFTQGFQQSFVFTDTIEQPVICLVTLDSLTQKNMVIWERQRGFSTAYYNIFRESTTAGVYVKIGTSPFDSLSVFIDHNSNPRKQAHRYRISAVDSFGNESSRSPVHKTIHLTAYKGLSNENHLIWTAYEGKSIGTYYIYRGTSYNNLALIDSIQSSLTEYSDFTASPGLQYYFVTFKFLDWCYPAIYRASTSSGPYSQSVSNLKDYSSFSVDYLSVAPAIQALQNSADTAIFEVFTNLDSFTAVSDQPWLTTTIDTATNRVIASAEPNISKNMRSANITVSGLKVGGQNAVVFQNGGYTGIASKPALTDLLVYPNPYQGFTNILFSIDHPSNLTVNVYSLTGKLIKNFYSGTAPSGKYHYKFSANESRLEAGLYLLIIQINNKQYIRKLIELK